MDGSEKSNRFRRIELYEVDRRRDGTTANGHEIVAASTSYADRAGLTARNKILVFTETIFKIQIY